MSPSHNPCLRPASLAAIALMGAGSSAFAATVYWDGVTGNWSDVLNWSTVSAATTPDPAAVPTGGDTSIFNITTADGDQTVYLDGDRGSSSSRIALQFDNTGTTQLLGGTSETAANHILYTTSITLNAGAGAVTIGDTTGSPARRVDIQTGSHSFSNNSSSLFTIANGIRSVGTGGTTTLTFTGTGNTSILGQVNNGTGTNVVALTKSGNGTLTLSGVNIYSSATTISGGNLTVASTGVINNANATTGTGSINGGATLSVDGGTAMFNTSAGGNVGLQVGTTTAGNVVVTNNGTLTISTGRMILGGSSAGSGTSSFTQDSGTTTVASNFYSGNYNASNIAISGGSFTVNGTSNISQRAITNFTISGTANVTFPTLNLGGQPGTYDVNINLNGGTLSVNTVANTVNGNTYFNFDGGTLKARQAHADFLNADLVYVKAGGATIDTDGFDVTIDNQLLQFEATIGALTKTGSGTLTLSNANTYAGDTDVRTGTLVLAAGGSQKFYPKADASSNKITDSDTTVETGEGEGTINLDGAFVIDLDAAAAAAHGTEWLLVDVDNLTETYGSTFTVTDFTETPADSGIWKRTVDASTFTFTESTGKLSLAGASLSGFASWITGTFSGGSVPVGQQGPNEDPDNDGIANLLEFVLNGDPTISDPSILPTLDASGSNFVFTYTRRNDSLSPETTQTFQYGSDLVGWTDVIVPAGNATVGAATIVVTDGSPADTVEISIPKTEALGTGKLFGHLKVSN